MKKIAFLTGTRADFGKLKTLIEVVDNDKNFECFVFVTGMHLNPVFGETVYEIIKCGFSHITQSANHEDYSGMDEVLAQTVLNFSKFVNSVNPDLIVVHGDRVEALAGAIVGALNNIRVAHVEGGEVSGTIDELIRHSVSKLSHVHFVSHSEARDRLIQMGEVEKSIFIIGSPDLDIMFSDKLPTIEDVKLKYEIKFKNYAVLMYHPVTTENDTRIQIQNLITAAKESGMNYVVIYPNNDSGSDEILSEYEGLKSLPHFRVFPSLRFEYFLTLLKNSRFIIGNSSAGIREAPLFNVPTVDIGTRQKNRWNAPSIIHSDYGIDSILSAIKKALKITVDNNIYAEHYGTGNSAQLFHEAIQSDVWKVKIQKQFKDVERWQ